MSQHPPAAGVVCDIPTAPPRPATILKESSAESRSRTLRTLIPREDPADERRIVRMSSIARLCLSLCTLALYFFEAYGPRTALQDYIWAYALYSLAVFAVLEWKPDLGIRLRAIFTLIDVVSLTFLAIVAGDSQGALYVMSLLVLYSVAHRSGLHGAAVTGVLMGGLYLLVSAAHSALVHHQWVVWGWPFFRESLVPFAYILLASLLVGIGSEEIKALHAERLAIAKVLGCIRPNAALKPTLSRVCADLIGIFKARRILVAAHEKAAGVVQLLEAVPCGSDESSLRIEELDEDQCEIYLFRQPGTTWSTEIPPAADTGDFPARVLDAKTWRVRRLPVRLPAGLLMVHPCRSLLVHSFDPSPEWSVRIFVMDAEPGLSRRAGLFFMFKLCSQVWPAVFEIFLARKSLQKAAQLERASLARELHDGVIQTLVTIDMKLETLRNKCESHPDNLSKRIENIQENLRDEVREQRNLMRRLRRPNLEPAECVVALRGAAGQFEEETGIATHFESRVDRVALPPRVCGEMLRILQEALVNVRKHSAARSVEITLREGKLAYELSISDDGRGFDFRGFLTFKDLESLRKGPEILKERVRLVSGELAIDSSPGQGTRLEITIPRELHDSEIA